MNASPATAERRSLRFRHWIEFVVLGLGLPLAIWACSKLLNSYIPAASSGSADQRFVWWVVGPAIAEWLFVIGVAATLHRRGLSLRSIGVWSSGKLKGWAVALTVGALSIGSNLRFLPRMGIPLSAAFFPRGAHLVAALTMGITAGFCEEVLFRAFLMTEFRDAGYGRVGQVLLPGVAFGLAHAGYINQGFIPWLGIAVPTAIIGMLFGVAYLLGKRSLLPAIVAHFLNDATALPWISFFMFTGALGRHG